MTHRILGLILLMAGLVVGHSALAEPASKPSPAPASKPTGAATIIVSRVSEGLYRLASASIEVNDQSFASLMPGDKHVGKVRPGPTTISASQWAHPGRWVVRFNAQPGRTYHFVVSARMEAMAPAILGGLTGAAIDAAANKDAAGAFKIQQGK